MPAQLKIRQTVVAAAQRLKLALEKAAEQCAQTEAAEAAYRTVRTGMDQCLAELRTTGLVGADNRLPSSELWKIAGQLLEPGWMLYRARIKPRGYAGDYELLGRMYENRLCDDPLGKLLDRYFQEDAAPVAVRNRMRMIAEWIVAEVRERAAPSATRPIRIAIVGSAFGLDVRDAFVQLTSGERAAVAIALLDLDPAAVEFARAQILPLAAAESVTGVSGSILKLPVRPQLAEPLQGTDLLFCPGIFDYLNDDEAASMLRLFYERLAPGGRMTVFQFAPHNPSRALMEWIGNWYLIYRDELQFRSVANRSAIPSSAMEFGAEPLGVDLFVTARKV